MERRRRSVSSSLGNIDLGEAREQRELVIEDESELYKTSANPFAKQQFQNGKVQGNQIPDHLRNNPNITINSSEEDDAEIDRRIEAAREAKRNERARPQSISRLEVLVGIGRLTDDIIVDNVTFSLRSLKNKEFKDVIERAAEEHTKVGEILSIRQYTLAYSIYKIEGQPVEVFTGNNSYKSKVQLIEELDENTVGILWDKYNKMQNDYKATIKQDLGETPKELLDTLKKS